MENFKFVKIGEVPKIVDWELWEEEHNSGDYEFPDGIYADFCLCHPERRVKPILVIEGTGWDFRLPIGT